MQFCQRTPPECQRVNAGMHTQGCKCLVAKAGIAWRTCRYIIMTIKFCVTPTKTFGKHRVGMLTSTTWKEKRFDVILVDVK